jgi:hypothetical protein
MFEYFRHHVVDDINIVNSCVGSDVIAGRRTCFKAVQCLEFPSSVGYTVYQSLLFFSFETTSVEQGKSRKPLM